METVDDEIRDLVLKFIEKAKADNRPFFLWLNPTRMHIVTHLSPKYEAMRNSKNGWSIEEAGMAQLDDIVGAIDALPEGRHFKSSFRRPRAPVAFKAKPNPIGSADAILLIRWDRKLV